MVQHEDDLTAVQALMIKLLTLTQSAKLGYQFVCSLCFGIHSTVKSNRNATLLISWKTELRPIICQDTRFSSTFAMVQRCWSSKMLMTMIAGGDANASCDNAPSCAIHGAEGHRVCIEVASGGNVDLLDVRQWFEGLIAVKPHYSGYLDALIHGAIVYHNNHSSIIHTPDFELGCVRVLRGRKGRLTRTEKAALLPCARVVEADATTSSGHENLSFVERTRKRHRTVEAKVSDARTAATRASSIDARDNSFFKENRRYWDASTVDSLN
ncbi:hypothetical protein PHMEG_00025570 [Phytophthora megakarya]|uniref:Uncharacterized protein n=1 Tax=Phytophthora megakarya TaxID=4795 RepID=A0A225VCH9_9STRA|nr:hypothetical protein PHMEG_00025570 [Phytophthora megakarya]